MSSFCVRSSTIITIGLVALAACELRAESAELSPVDANTSVQFPGAGVGAAVGASLGNVAGMTVGAAVLFDCCFLSPAPAATLAGLLVFYATVVVVGNTVGSAVGGGLVLRAPLIADYGRFLIGGLAGGATAALTAIIGMLIAMNMGSSVLVSAVFFGAPVVGIIAGSVTTQAIVGALE